MPLQNFQFEIEAVRSELDQITEISRPDQQKILEKCYGLLSQTDTAFCRWPPRELFVWQMLFRIRQNILLIAPVHELSAKCFVLKKRLRRLGTDTDCKITDGARWRKLVEEVERYLAGRQGPNQDEMKLRSNLKEVCAFLDEQVILQLWTSIKLRRHSTLFVLVAIVLMGLLIAHLYDPSIGQIADDCGKLQHSPILMVAAGTLGALVSMLVRDPADPKRGAPLADVSIVRPVIGGISGLFLFMAPQTELIQIKYPTFYAVAIAFGFTERVFFGAIRKLAGDTEKHIEERRAK